MIPRTPHGNAKDLGAEGIVLESEPLDEKPSMPTVAASPLQTGRDKRGRVTTTEAARELAQRPRRAAFRPRNIEPAPDFASYYRDRLQWLERRASEFATFTGGNVSAGVFARLRKSAWAWAWSEYADDLAAKTGDLDRAEQAARLAEKADKFDWSAWTMACKETGLANDRGGDEGDELRAKQAAFQRQLADRQKGAAT